MHVRALVPAANPFWVYPSLQDLGVSAAGRAFHGLSLAGLYTGRCHTLFPADFASPSTGTRALHFEISAARATAVVFPEGRGALAGAVRDVDFFIFHAAGSSCLLNRKVDSHGWQSFE